MDGLSITQKNVVYCQRKLNETFSHIENNMYADKNNKRKYFRIYPDELAKLIAQIAEYNNLVTLYENEEEVLIDIEQIYKKERERNESKVHRRTNPWFVRRHTSGPGSASRFRNRRSEARQKGSVYLL